jgi:hypothetical protein
MRTAIPAFTRWFDVLALALVALAVSAFFDSAVAQDDTCLWRGPYGTTPGASNTLYADLGARYWSAQFTVPAGAQVLVHGQYPQSRYMSYTAYTSTGTASSLHDISINPDADGSINPFIAGNARLLTPRNYTVYFVPGSAPSSGAAPNTVYSGTTDNTFTLIYREYVPDSGTDITGNAGYPQPTVINADGSTVTGSAACTELQASSGLLTIAQPNLVAYLGFYLVGGPLGLLDQWQQLGPILTAALSGANWFPTPDNAYLEMNLNRNEGVVAVLTGTLPTTPTTLYGDAVMGTGDLRYWSVCMYEFYTQKATSCLFDQQLQTDASGNYVIAISRTADRPSNATNTCGFNWMQWSDAGDGAAFPNAGMLMLRNMLPSSSFTQAIQNVPGGVLPSLTMGPYLPTVTHQSVAQFQARGCSS